MSDSGQASEYKGFFREATEGQEAFPYQCRLARERVAGRAIHVPTGAGKTAAVVLAWLWRRQVDKEHTPRRLVYCLPTRVLVEQVRGEVDRWVGRVASEVKAYSLMGGEVEEGWEMHPEQAAILDATQDMLLNRGYAMNRYRRPVHFGLLNNDCLWVCDEVQLMGNGLGTTTQLHAFREEARTFGPAVAIR